VEKAKRNILHVNTSQRSLCSLSPSNNTSLSDKSFLVRKDALNTVFSLSDPFSHYMMWYTANISSGWTWFLDSLHVANAWPPLHNKRLVSLLIFVAFTNNYLCSPDFSPIELLFELVDLDPEICSSRTVLFSKEMTHFVKNFLKSSYLGISALKSDLFQYLFVFSLNLLFRTYE